MTNISTARLKGFPVKKILQIPKQVMHVILRINIFIEEVSPVFDGKIDMILAKIIGLLIEKPMQYIHKLVVVIKGSLELKVNEIVAVAQISIPIISVF